MESEIINSTVSDSRIIKLTCECESVAEFYKLMGPNYLEKYWVGKHIIKFDPDTVSLGFRINSVSYNDSLVDNTPVVVILAEYELIGE